MGRYRFIKVFDVDADDEQAARALLDAGESRSVSTALLWQVQDPREPVYVQPREILDLAWDRYMDLTLPEGSATMYPGAPRLPQAHLLHELGLLSMMFDNAITAYRESVEPRE